ncbi:MAG: hypothetical protein ACK55U_08160, partial [Bacteroidota bacterium]
DRTLICLGAPLAFRPTTKGSWRGMSARARTNHSFHYKFPTPHYLLLVGVASVGQFCAVYAVKTKSMEKHKKRAMIAIGVAVAIVVGLVSTGRAQTEVYTSNSRTTNYRTSNGVSSFSVEVRGKIELTDDDRDIKSMSPDGYLEIKKTVFGSRRSLVVKPAGNTLKREYYEGRELIPFEPEGRRWMNEILPEMVRATTIGAESRVNRFYRNGGVNSVLDEINRLESDHVKAHYAKILTSLNLTAKDYPTVVSRVAQSIDSDHYLSEFLRNNLQKLVSTKESADAVFTATNKMESDHYKAEVIKDALRIQAASPESLRIVLQAAGKMESDHYKTEVLTSMLRQSAISDATIAELLASARSIDSDHYRTIVINRALDKPNLSQVSYQKALEAVQGIESDHYKTEVMRHLLRGKIAGDQVKTLVTLSGSVDSDHYVTEIMKEVLETQDLSDADFKLLMTRVETLDSDHYASQILKAALDSRNMNSAKLLTVLQAAGHIDSDHYISEVLLDAAEQVRTGSAELKEAYRATAKKIDSDVYYGRVIKAIDR